MKNLILILSIILIISPINVIGEENATNQTEVIDNSTNLTIPIIILPEIELTNFFPKKLKLEMYS